MQVIIILLMFMFLQILLCSKVKRTIIRYLPFIFVAIGYLLCLALWLGAFDSFSDVASNRWLAIILLAIFSGGFIGCLIGVTIFKLLKRKNK